MKKTTLIQIVATTLVVLFCTFNSFAQTLVNREWVQTNGVLDQVNYSVSAIDISNNLIVASNIVVVGQDANLLVTKYDQQGNIIWQQTFNGSSNNKDYSTAVTTDASGNIYVTGATFSTSSDYNYITIMYDASGTQQWSAVYNGNANNIDIPTAIAVDASGNVYVTGASIGATTLTDYKTIKYNSSGTQQWATTYDFASGYELPIGIVIDNAAGKAIITGASASGINNWDYTTVEYDLSGNYITSVRNSATGAGFDKPTAIKRDATGNLYITGAAFNATSHHQGGQNNYPQSLDDNDIQHLLIKYAVNVGGESSNIVGAGRIDAGATLEHIDLGHGYWVQHGSPTSGVLTNLGNITMYFGTGGLFTTPAMYGIPPGVYTCTKVKNTYTYAIPLPSFASNAQIIDAWSSHSAAMSAANPNDGTYYSNLTNLSVSGNVAYATMETYSYKVLTNSIGQSYNVWIPSATNLVKTGISLLMYDPTVAGINKPTIITDFSFDIFPNPTTDVVSINIASTKPSTYTLEIFNIMGQTVVKHENIKVEESKVVEIPLVNLPSGVYNCRLVSSDKSACKKIILTK
jgi:hypothetical protein